MVGPFADDIMELSWLQKNQLLRVKLQILREMNIEKTVTRQRENGEQGRGGVLGEGQGTEFRLVKLFQRERIVRDLPDESKS